MLKMVCGRSNGGRVKIPNGGQKESITNHTKALENQRIPNPNRFVPRSVF